MSAGVTEVRQLSLPPTQTLTTLHPCNFEHFFPGQMSSVNNIISQAQPCTEGKRGAFRGLWGNNHQRAAHLRLSASALKVQINVQSQVVMK